MEWIDTHTHLYVPRFDEDRDEVVQRAMQGGVTDFYLPNIDSGSIPAMLEMEEKWPGHCHPMMGLHPTSVKENYKEELDLVENWLQRRSFVAIGEIGIDLYWDKTRVAEQEDAFLQQIKWASELDLPFVIHSRESIDQIIRLIEGSGLSNLRGIFHCFTGTAAQGEKIRELGFYLGIGGVVTFKNAGLDKTMAELGPARVVLETDAPYLAPKPHRGKRNESRYLTLVGEKCADIWGMSLEEVAELTTAHARTIFS